MYMYALPFFTVATLCTNQRISYLASIRVALKRLFLRVALYSVVQLNDAFCKTPPWLAQKVCTGSAHAAVSKVCADAVLKKVLNVRRKKAGEFLKDVRAINAIKLEDSHLLEGVPYCWFRAFLL